MSSRFVTDRTHNVNEIVLSHGQGNECKHSHGDEKNSIQVDLQC